MSDAAGLCRASDIAMQESPSHVMALASCGSAARVSSPRRPPREAALAAYAMYCIDLSRVPQQRKLNLRARAVPLPAPRLRSRFYSSSYFFATPEVARRSEDGAVAACAQHVHSQTGHHVTIVVVWSYTLGAELRSHLRAKRRAPCHPKSLCVEHCETRTYISLYALVYS